MLVLSRKPGERILIGETIALTVVEVKGQRVTLGIDAPKSISIFRSELQVILDEPSPAPTFISNVSAETLPTSNSTW